MNTLSKALLALAIIGLIVGLVLYLRGTVMVEVTNGPVTVDEYRCYFDQGFLSKSHYCEVEVTPTVHAEPATKYLLVIDNGIVKQNYKVSWSQLELGIHKTQTLTNKISRDEYTALGMEESHLTVFEIRPQRQMFYLVPGIALLVAFLSYYVAVRLRTAPSSSAVSLGEEEIVGAHTPEAVPVHHPSSPQGKTWWVPLSGLSSEKPPPDGNERTDRAGTVPEGEIIDVQSPYGDSWTDQRINRLHRKGRIDIREAESLRRQTKNMGFFEKQSFLRNIEFGDEDEEI
jgi:hypothetical protein